MHENFYLLIFLGEHSEKSNQEKKKFWVQNNENITDHTHTYVAHA